MRLPGPRADCWMDGEQVAPESVRIPFDDPAVQAGMGLFETLAIRDGRVLELDAHLDRMARGASRLELEIPRTERLTSAAVDVASRRRLACGWLKIVVTGGGRCIVFADEMDPAEEGRSVRAVLLPWCRGLRDPLSGLKTLNYAASVVGLAEARRRGADEGIWLNSRGQLAEACTSNLFLVHRGKLFTPGEKDGILPGVVRGITLQAARNLRLAVHEGKVRLRRLEQAAEAFLTSSLRGLCPVIRFQNRPVGNGLPGPVTLRLAAEVARLRGRSPGAERPGSAAGSPGKGG